MIAGPPLPASCRVAVAGGGAAGFFAALACAESGGGPVILLEKSSLLLAKVKISGGGRCNVTHACFEPAGLAERYPRGGRELLGAFHRFQPRDTIEWFEARGVRLKTEPDGRMFPTTDRSETISSALLEAARRANVRVITQAGISRAERKGSGFFVTMDDGRTLECERLILATGGPRGSGGGPAIAAALGHRISPPVPSLFTFTIQDPRLAGLAGVSVPEARVRVPETALDETGPVLITHWGLSGPGILRVSAWGARVLAERRYEFPLRVNWVPRLHRDSAVAELREAKVADGRRTVVVHPLFGLPVRLWERLAAAAGILPETRWSAITRPQLLDLATQITEGEFQVRGKSLNKEEFVTCGGVALREVDFRTMQSRLCPGLYFAGEVLDLDGVTGGFNFQAAWTTGWLAGRAAAAPENCRTKS